MAYYRNNYESYYRRMKNNVINSNEKDKNYSKKRNTMSKIIIYDLSVSLFFLLSLIALKNVQIDQANTIYSEMKNKINERNETLENYNTNFYDEALDVFNGILNSNDNN